VSNIYKEMLRKMVTIRTIEERIAKDFLASKIFSFLHLSIGQEGAAVGVCLASKVSDVVFGNHRSHGHYIARGGNIEKMIREVYGEVGGCCRGYGGSMHMLDRSVGFVGSTPILGSVAPIGVGLGYAQNIAGTGGVAFVFIGDGAAEEGAFYESVNLAGVLKSPVIFVIEDNGYCVNSSHDARKAPGYAIGSIVEGLGASYRRVDGQRVWDVHQATVEVREVSERMRRPAVLHVDVVRGCYGHSGPLKETEPQYRASEPEERRNRSCCIANLKEYLLDRGVNSTEIENIACEAEMNAINLFDSIRGTFEVRR
jgi:acetoin:2,6-dichlorophenolindophenol oxidoreductase subunit alpha